MFDSTKYYEEANLDGFASFFCLCTTAKIQIVHDNDGDVLRVYSSNNNSCILNRFIR